jgi:hypothetical protein
MACDTAWNSNRFQIQLDRKLLVQCCGLAETIDLLVQFGSRVRKENVFANRVLEIASIAAAKDSNSSAKPLDLALLPLERRQMSRARQSPLLRTPLV